MAPSKLTPEQKNWNKKYPSGKANLSWTLEDYRIWEIPPPECLLKNPFLTEGEQMSNREIEEWFIESIKVLKIFKETEEKTFERLYKELILDIKYLISIGRMDTQYLDFVLDKERFNF